MHVLQPALQICILHRRQILRCTANVLFVPPTPTVARVAAEQNRLRHGNERALHDPKGLEEGAADVAAHADVRLDQRRALGAQHALHRLEIHPERRVCYSANSTEHRRQSALQVLEDPAPCSGGDVQGDDDDEGPRALGASVQNFVRNVSGSVGGFGQRFSAIFFGVLLELNVATSIPGGSDGRLRRSQLLELAEKARLGIREVGVDFMLEVRMALLCGGDGAL
eukprot:scaffold2870_cov267-Pinguiococcus_pyrenoidosus.AAC.11